MATDAFGRGAQATLGANWTEMYQGLKTDVLDHCIESGSDNNFAAAYYNAGSFTADHDSAIDVVAIAGICGPAVRCTLTTINTTFSCYIAVLHPSVTQICKYENGTVGSPLVSNGVGWSAGEKAKLEAVGTAIKLYRWTAGAWVQELSTTDSSFATGRPGLMMRNAAGNSFDNWVGNDVSGGTSIAPPVGSLSFAGVAAALVFTLRIANPAGSLAFTGIAPAASITTPSAVATPTAGALTYAGTAPNINSGAILSVPVGAVTFTGTGTQIAFSGPDVGALTITGTTPVLAFGGNPLKQPPAGSLAFTGNAPSAISPSGGSRSRWRARR